MHIEGKGQTGEMSYRKPSKPTLKKPKEKWQPFRTAGISILQGRSNKLWSR